MRIFKNWKYTSTNAYGIPTFDVDDEDGNDWYWLSAYLEVRPEKWVVGVSPTGDVLWFTDGSVYNTHAPLDGGTVIVCDNFDHTVGYRQRWIGDGWVILDSSKPRTLAEVESDMRNLLEELSLLKESKGGV